MKKLNSLTLVAALVLLSLVRSYGQTLISTVPYTISSPGTYVLANDLSYYAVGAAITINSGNVTLDFGGHILAAVTHFVGLTVGVQINPARNVTIKNGTVQAFEYGIFFDNKSGVSDATYNSGHIVENMRNLLRLALIRTEAVGPLIFA